MPDAVGVKLCLRLLGLVCRRWDAAGVLSRAIEWEARVSAVWSACLLLVEWMPGRLVVRSYGCRLNGSVASGSTKSLSGHWRVTVVESDRRPVRLLVHTWRSQQQRYASIGADHEATVTIVMYDRQVGDVVACTSACPVSRGCP